MNVNREAILDAAEESHFVAALSINTGTVFCLMMPAAYVVMVLPDLRHGAQRST